MINFRTTSLLSIAILCATLPLKAQSSKTIARPKLVVGVVVDQMRWDYLYRFYDRFSEGGFKRLLSKGFSAENTLIPYSNTITAPGHTCIYTGSVPAIHGIVGNNWFNSGLDTVEYCTDDKFVKPVGASENAQPMSPKNLWVTTITDELRLATNFESKVVSISIKDRGSILPGGHFGEAYWYDINNGNFITSSFYKPKLPDWVIRFNNRRLPDSLYQLNWNTLYPIDSYQQSDQDDVPYESKLIGTSNAAFPHSLSQFVGKNYEPICTSPHGNTLTLEMAKAAMEAESLGQDAIPDFLAVSFSSNDLIGHSFGPNSIEIEDNVLRLDRTIETLLNHLDLTVGEGQYTVFLSADHGVAHIPGFMQKHGFDVSNQDLSLADLNKKVQQKFGINNALRSLQNCNLYLNQAQLKKVKSGSQAVIAFIINELQKRTDVLTAFELKNLQSTSLPSEIKERVAKAYNPIRSGDIQYILKSGYINGYKTGVGHQLWYNYDAHIPAVFMGWGIKPGKTNRTTYMTDIAPTLAALLHIQMPSGCIGTPITEAIY